MKYKRFLVLDSFRGLCALSVALFHMHISGGFSEIDFFRGSAILVDFFFVLSGFVLTHRYGVNICNSFGDFFVSRFARVYPLHLFTFFLFFMMELFKVIATKYGFSFNNEPFSGVNSLDNIIPNLLLLQSWLEVFPHESFNYPSWSISVEFYLYLIFFFTLQMTIKLRLLTWFLLPFLSFIIYDISIIPNEALRGIIGFFVGALTYKVFTCSQNLILKPMTTNVLEAFLLITLFYVVSNHFIYRELISYLLFAMIVLIFSKEKGLISNVLRNKLFVKLGSLSFSVYMLHAFILQTSSFAISVVEKLSGENLSVYYNGIKYLDLGGVITNNVFIIFLVCIILFMSVLSNKYIEILGRDKILSFKNVFYRIIR
ncbi:acyltransferase [Moritella sp.]|uniref:acyltransferase family protein n=1 Tax=Moritella sp. TaxID=78556 RepID=UPI001DFDDC1A|nr:acyltransferase [Moritella sp.]MCJ8347946.1 acyltransferase [Moritella sp.]NQZ40381.1 acyltransferase [Moritella sp.]